MVKRNDPGPRPPEWLQGAWIRQLRWQYDLYNEQYLGGRLQPPVFRLGSSTTKLGEWNSLNHTMTIGLHHILEHPWEAVLDTLRHEMAHQYVDDVLQLTHAPPHSEPFVKACRLLRCNPSPAAASGALGNVNRSSAERDKILVRIKELLALAGSPNEHEAANAMRMAHRYLLKYNLNLAQLEGRSSYGVRHLGKCSARIQEYRYVLSSILQDQFFVLAIWTFSYDPLRNVNGRMLQISGTSENLEMAEYVYNYVINLCESLWQQRRQSSNNRSGTKFQYLAGLLRGLQEKLDRQNQQLKEEHGLVWLGDPELKKYFGELHPRTRSVAAGGVSRGSEYRDGVRDGRKINIRRGVTTNSRNRGRLLG